jgi:hypothetical protein
MIPLLLLFAQVLPQGAFERGMEAAQARDWEQARREFLLGYRAFPADKRFPIELAGVEYRLGNPLVARRYLHEALRLDPADNYANDFLGTLYFVAGNAEAALKYWNRVGKPRIEFVQTVPASPVKATLLDRAIATAPGSLLRLDGYLSTRAWIEGLDAFGAFRLDLEAKEHGEFGTVLRWGGKNRLAQVGTLLSGLPVQILNAELHNLGGKALTASMSLRWDAQKRRLLTSFSGPLNGDPRRRYTVFSDIRRETWNLGVPEDFRLNKQSAGASIRWIRSGRLWWETGARLAHRTYVAAPGFPSGSSLTQYGSTNYTLVNLPERSLTVDAGATAELSRLFATGGGLYSRSQIYLLGRWIPDGRRLWDVSSRLSAARIFGGAPFDELYSLGRERDDGIQLRGHVSTMNGKKGRSQIGNQYALANIDVLRQVWKPALFALDAGPLLDIGRMGHELPVPGITPGRIQVDAGLQVRFRLPNNMSVVFSYARDLRGGRGAFDTSLR